MYHLRHCTQKYTLLILHDIPLSTFSWSSSPHSYYPSALICNQADTYDLVNRKMVARKVRLPSHRLTSVWRLRVPYKNFPSLDFNSTFLHHFIPLIMGLCFRGWLEKSTQRAECKLWHVDSTQPPTLKSENLSLTSLQHPNISFSTHQKLWFRCPAFTSTIGLGAETLSQMLRNVVPASTSKLISNPFISIFSFHKETLCAVRMVVPSMLKVNLCYNSALDDA